jgi:hypothetical protein
MGNKEKICDDHKDPTPFVPCAAASVSQTLDMSVSIYGSEMNNGMIASRREQNTLK